MVAKCPSTIQSNYTPRLRNPRLHWQRLRTANALEIPRSYTAANRSMDAIFEPESQRAT